jgi:hypothetical protein
MLIVGMAVFINVYSLWENGSKPTSFVRTIYMTSNCNIVRYDASMAVHDGCKPFLNE